MTFLEWLLLLGFLGGQVASVSFANGIRIALLDLVVAVYVGINLITAPKPDLKPWLKIAGPFIGVALVSLLFNVSRFSLNELSISALYLVRFIVYTLLLITVGKSTKQADAITKTLRFGGIGIAVVGLIQYFIYPNLRNLYYLGWDPHQFRIFSTLLDPNFTGIILVLAALLNIYFKSQGTSKWWSWIQITTVAALFLTYSRGALVTFICVLGLRSIMRRRVREMVLYVAFFTITILVLPRPAGEGVNLLRTLSIESRLKDSQEALSIWQKSPIFGVGFNTLRFTRGLTEVSEGTTSLPHAGAGFHNSWLFLLVTTGVVGLIAYLWLWVSILKAFDWKEPKGQLVWLSVMAVFIHSFFDNSLFFAPIMFWVWSLAGSFSKFPKNKAGTLRIH